MVLISEEKYGNKRTKEEIDEGKARAKYLREHGLSSAKYYNWRDYRKRKGYKGDISEEGYVKYLREQGMIKDGKYYNVKEINESNFLEDEGLNKGNEDAKIDNRLKTELNDLCNSILKSLNSTQKSEEDEKEEIIKYLKYNGLKGTDEELYKGYKSKALIEGGEYSKKDYVKDYHEEQYKKYVMKKSKEK